MDKLTANIKRVMIVFLAVFLLLMGYLSYFTLVKGPQIVTNTDNKRLWDIRNQVERGTIFDRNGKALSVSEKTDDGKYKRVYKGGAATAHALGYFDERFGITGLENLYDQRLSSNISTSFGAWLANGFKSTNKKGDDVYTTLDYSLQKTAYDAIGDKNGAVVVLNAKTSEILTLVSKPSFDPNKLSQNWEALNKDKDIPLLNRAVSGMYPPGSTFKVVTGVSALDNISGIENEVYEDKGKIDLGGGYTLANDNNKVMGNINLHDAMVRSSNVYFGELGIRLNNDLFDTAQKFMFNKNIPSDGLIIDTSRFPDYSSNEKGNLAQTGIGQAEILATPIQMALVAQAVANDGIMMKPSLVSKVTDYNQNTIKSFKPDEIATISNAENIGKIKLYMKDVVSKGTGTRAQVKGVSVCGKTGTAQHVESKTPHSWFIGFAPYDNPQVAIAVLVEEGGYGGTAAARITSQVLSKYFAK